MLTLKLILILTWISVTATGVESTSTTYLNEHSIILLHWQN